MKSIDIPTQRFSRFAAFPILIGLIALLLGLVLGKVNASFSIFAIAAIFIVIALVLHQDELAVTIVLAINFYVDFYLGLGVVSQVMAVALLVIFFLARSPGRQWAEPRTLWLWTLILLLALSPALRGITLFDGAYYYINIIFGAFIFLWLGTVIARDALCLRRFLQFISIFGTLIAVHAIIQATTGVFLFATSRFDMYFAEISYYLLGASGVERAGSFLVNPDSSGCFFGMMLFIPLCLFVESSSIMAKLFFLVEMFLMLVALLFSYSTGGWLGACAGMIPFLVFVGRNHYRVLVPLCILSVSIVLILCFPTQINLQIQHALQPSEASLREGAWMTGIRVIQAFPLTGIGLGRYDYLTRAEPYRVLQQYRPLAHPHNSYLEIGALAGLPVLFVFMVLLGVTFWLAMRNWSRSNTSTRTLIGGGIATTIALSANSLVANAWTLVPLAALGWLILGVITSPLLMKSQVRDATKEDQAG